MDEQAAHLVDRVLPQVPCRQWVLTLPGELVRVVAFDGELTTEVFGVFADELSRWQRERANDLGIADPQTGSLLEIQRFRPRAARLRRAFCRLANGARPPQLGVGHSPRHTGAAPPTRCEGVSSQAPMA